MWLILRGLAYECVCSMRRVTHCTLLGPLSSRLQWKCLAGLLQVWRGSSGDGVGLGGGGRVRAGRRTMAGVLMYHLPITGRRLSPGKGSGGCALKRLVPRRVKRSSCCSGRLLGRLPAPSMMMINAESASHIRQHQCTDGNPTPMEGRTSSCGRQA